MISISDLSFGYQSAAPLFTEMVLKMSGGGIYGLLGKNGAGKTTLLKLVAGLLFPDSGQCEVMGFRPQHRWPEFLQEVYMIPEEFYVPSIPARRYEQLYAPFYPRFDKVLFNTYLDEFEINQGHKLSALSYGQKKKFLLAFGLATDCKLLILDEPTNGLDIPTKSLFRKFLASAIRDERCFIISTHQVRDMEQLIDPVIIIDDGRIIFNQSTALIQKHLSCHIQTERPEGDNILYSEKVLGGHCVVVPNTTDEETTLDLEVLFNTAISNPAAVNQLFSRGG